MITVIEQAKLKGFLSVAFGNIGNVYQILGELEKALEYHKKSLEIAEKIGDLAIQASILVNMGAVYCGLRDYEQGLSYFHRAREICVKIGAKLEIEQTDQNIALARQKLAEQVKRQ